jgi:hypothetical protein
MAEKFPPHFTELREFQALWLTYFAYVAEPELVLMVAPHPHKFYTCPSSITATGSNKLNFLWDSGWCRLCFRPKMRFGRRAATPTKQCTVFFNCRCLPLRRGFKSVPGNEIVLYSILFKRFSSLSHVLFRLLLSIWSA